MPFFLANIEINVECHITLVTFIWNKHIFFFNFITFQFCFPGKISQGFDIWNVWSLSATLKLPRGKMWGKSVHRKTGKVGLLGHRRPCPILSRGIPDTLFLSFSLFLSSNLAFSNYQELRVSRRVLEQGKIVWNIEMEVSTYKRTFPTLCNKIHVYEPRISWRTENNVVSHKQIILRKLFYKLIFMNIMIFFLYLYIF